MQPSVRNRVTLASRKDQNGVPLPLVEHDCSELDRRTLVELHRVLRDELRANGIGELEGDLERAKPWPIDQDASHHMGGTRMGADARTSVVDPDLRLHGAENVWVAGSSVFPASVRPMSIPDDTPAAVTYLPSNTTRWLVGVAPSRASSS